MDTTAVNRHIVASAGESLPPSHMDASGVRFTVKQPFLLRAGPRSGRRTSPRRPSAEAMKRLKSSLSSRLHSNTGKEARHISGDVQDKRSAGADAIWRDSCITSLRLPDA